MSWRQGGQSRRFSCPQSSPGRHDVSVIRPITAHATFLGGKGTPRGEPHASKWSLSVRTAALHPAQHPNRQRSREKLKQGSEGTTNSHLDPRLALSQLKLLSGICGRCPDVEPFANRCPHLRRKEESTLSSERPHSPTPLLPCMLSWHGRGGGVGVQETLPFRQRSQSRLGLSCSC